MGFKREDFAPLFKNLLHLEITLVSHPFINRTSAPDPETQCADLIECYVLAVKAAKDQKPLESADITGAAFEAFGASSPDSGAGRPLTSFADIADFAGETFVEIQTRATMPRDAGPPIEMAGVEAADAKRREEGTGQQIAELDPTSQEVLLIQNNARHIDQILRGMGYESPGPGNDRGSYAEEGAFEGSASPIEPEKKVPESDSKGIEWTPEGIMQIRKYWEVRPGDGVLMRTVIGMDGDVVAHINPLIVGEDYEVLHELHVRSVATSVKFWQELAGILSDFITNAIRALTKS